MFLNSSLTINNVVSNVNLTTQNNELYENGIRVATQTDVDFLQQEIDNIVPGSANALVTDTPLITPSTGAIIFSDGLDAFGTLSDPSFTYQVADDQNFLTVGGAQLISSNNNMKLESPDYILTNKDFFLEGTEDVQRYLTIGRVGLINNVKTSVDITTSDYICDNQLASKTQWKGASEYDFDNDVRIGSATNIRKLFVNDIVVVPGGVTGPTGPTGATGATGDTGPTGLGVSNGMLRALNLNLLVPTVAQTYDVVWSNLTPAEQAIWAGGSEPPVASATGNYWNFSKLVLGTQKINWTLPFDFLTANLSFQDLQSVYAVVRLNTSSNITPEGVMWFQIQSQNIVPDPPLYRTRWNYANSASGVISQLGNTYKIYASDAIPLSTAASNTGKGQEVYPLQTKFKSNPCDVEPISVFSIPFTKFVGSPTGDTTAGYTSAFVQSIALNTASNINTYNFDLIAIGFNSVRYNLFYV
jgi:hypothetical protein